MDGAHNATHSFFRALIRDLQEAHELLRDANGEEIRRATRCRLSINSHKTASSATQ